MRRHSRGTGLQTPVSRHVEMLRLSWNALASLQDPPPPFDRSYVLSEGTFSCRSPNDKCFFEIYFRCIIARPAALRALCLHWHVRDGRFLVASVRKLFSGSICSACGPPRQRAWECDDPICRLRLAIGSFDERSSGGGIDEQFNRVQERHRKNKRSRNGFDRAVCDCSGSAAKREAAAVIVGEEYVGCCET